MPHTATQMNSACKHWAVPMLSATYIHPARMHTEQFQCTQKLARTQLACTGQFTCTQQLGCTQLACIRQFQCSQQLTCTQLARTLGSSNALSNWHALSSHALGSSHALISSDALSSHAHGSSDALHSHALKAVFDPNHCTTQVMVVLNPSHCTIKPKSW